MLRRVAEVLGVTLHVTLVPKGASGPLTLSEAHVAYNIRRKSVGIGGGVCADSPRRLRRGMGKAVEDNRSPGRFAKFA